MAKSPSLQFYPGDWQRDTALKMCSLAARGLWVEMMWLMFDGDPYGHLSVNGSVIPPDKLGVILGVDASEIKSLIAELEQYGVFSRNEQGVIYSRRMVNDRRRRDTNVLNGSKGGNPRLSKSVNRKDNPLRADANADSIKEGKKERASEKTTDLPFTSPKYLEAWTAFEQMRKKVPKAPWTDYARRLTIEKLSQMSEADGVKALENAITGGWRTVFPPDLPKRTMDKATEQMQRSIMDRNAPIEKNFTVTK